MSPYLSVFIATILWTVATQMYALVGRLIPIIRLNFYKSCISFTLFVIFTFAFKYPLPNNEAAKYLLISGFFGFAIGDIFAFYAFSKIGPARTFILASFAPTIVAIQSYLILDITLSLRKVIGLIFLLLCIIILMKEKRKDAFKFDFKMALIALAGISLDALGVIYSKKAFLLDPTLDSMSANIYRISTAVITLFILSLIRKIPISPMDLPKKVILLIVTSSIIGTFGALYFYLKGVAEIYNPSVVVALSSLLPIYASIYEHIRDRELPSKNFIAALVVMLVGVFLLIKQ